MLLVEYIHVLWQSQNWISFWAMNTILSSKSQTYPSQSLERYLYRNFQWVLLWIDGSHPDGKYPIHCGQPQAVMLPVILALIPYRYKQGILEHILFFVSFLHSSFFTYVCWFKKHDVKIVIGKNQWILMQVESLSLASGYARDTFWKKLEKSW